MLEAQQAAVEAVTSGVSCGEVDEAARSVLRREGLAEAFSHSTGHGVGLEIHEPPRIGAGQTTRLLPGMVITIEPGVYLPGKFGIRIEDMVAVTANRRPGADPGAEGADRTLKYPAMRVNLINGPAKPQDVGELRNE